MVVVGAAGPSPFEVELWLLFGREVPDINSSPADSCPDGGIRCSERSWMVELRPREPRRLLLLRLTVIGKDALLNKS